MRQGRIPKRYIVRMKRHKGIDLDSAVIRCGQGQLSTKRSIIISLLVFFTQYGFTNAHAGLLCSSCLHTSFDQEGGQQHVLRSCICVLLSALHYPPALHHRTGFSARRKSASQQQAAAATAPSAQPACQQREQSCATHTTASI